MTIALSPGLILSSIGGSFFELDKFSRRIGIESNTQAITAVRVLSAIAGSTTIILTRLPAMWNSEHRNESNLQPDHPFHKKARKISVIGFGCMGFFATLSLFMNAYLSGKTFLEDSFGIEGGSTGTMIFAFYVSVAAAMGSAFYSVAKAINHSYQANLVIYDGVTQRNCTCNKVLVKTILTTFTSVIASGTGFFFAPRYSIPIFLSDVFNVKNISSNSTGIIVTAGLLEIPNQATLIFSEPAAVMKYFSSNERILSGKVQGLKRNILLGVISLLTLLSVFFHGLQYYEYMSDLVGDSWGETITIIASLANATGGMFLYYVFNTRPAILDTENVLTNEKKLSPAVKSEQELTENRPLLNTLNYFKK